MSDLGDDLKGKHGKDKRNTVIAIGTVLLVVIAYITYRKLAGGGSGTAVTGTAGDVGTAGTAADTSLNGVTNLLSAENGVLQAILDKLNQPPPTPPDAPIPGGPTTNPGKKPIRVLPIPITKTVLKALGAAGVNPITGTKVPKGQVVVTKTASSTVPGPVLTFAPIAPPKTKAPNKPSHPAQGSKHKPKAAVPLSNGPGWAR